MFRFMRHTRLVILLFAAAIATASALVVPSVSQATVFGDYTISGIQSGMCLQPMDGSLGASIVQEPCTGNVTQVWTEETSQDSSKYDEWVNVWSGLCLDARGGDTDGTPIEQWTCGKISNINWTTGAGSPNSGSTFMPSSTLISGVSPYSDNYAILLNGYAGLPVQLDFNFGELAQNLWLRGPLCGGCWST